ncbi:hypothetical protein AGDE_08133 [Angomonas deanei]|uniref:Zn-finger in Ran binding protein and others, putative n=1 Tax=Angomonas deanei TaxID=59799 RepID=A0A7G2CNF0_9TRYP|nr:hypothetical protein AGDE_08133 [Angomonas deanei]CAD2221376.1 Zn-finger in Ran binding protein and others, putative [Angomonas deanei]|eukprot:EPY33959.1 hypothetical protein AGDE_08133 [Angomonas deanei]
MRSVARGRWTSAWLTGVRYLTRWACPCGFRNFDFREDCFRCFHRPDGQRVGSEEPVQVADSFREGDWMCACGAHNFSRRSECIACSQRRPGGVERAAPNLFRPGDWECSSCRYHNFSSRETCKKCGGAKSLRRDSSPVSGSPSGLWTCSQCHTLCRSDEQVCFLCGSKR